MVPPADVVFMFVPHDGTSPRRTLPGSIVLKPQRALPVMEFPVSPPIRFLTSLGVRTAGVVSLDGGRQLTLVGFFRDPPFPGTTFLPFSFPLLPPRTTFSTPPRVVRVDRFGYVGFEECSQPPFLPAGRLTFHLWFPPFRLFAVFDCWARYALFFSVFYFESPLSPPASFFWRV